MEFEKYTDRAKGFLQSAQNLALRRQYASEVASAEAQSYALAARADAQVVLNPQAID